MNWAILLCLVVATVAQRYDRRHSGEEGGISYRARRGNDKVSADGEGSKPIGWGPWVSRVRRGFNDDKTKKSGFYRARRGVDCPPGQKSWHGCNTYSFRDRRAAGDDKGQGSDDIKSWAPGAYSRVRRQDDDSVSWGPYWSRVRRQAEGHPDGGMSWDPYWSRVRRQAGGKPLEDQDDMANKLHLGFRDAGYGQSYEFVQQFVQKVVRDIRSLIKKYNVNPEIEMKFLRLFLINIDEGNPRDIMFDFAVQDAVNAFAVLSAMASQKELVELEFAVKLLQLAQRAQAQAQAQAQALAQVHAQTQAQAHSEAQAAQAQTQAQAQNHVTDRIRASLDAAGSNIDELAQNIATAYANARFFVDGPGVRVAEVLDAIYRRNLSAKEIKALYHDLTTFRHEIPSSTAAQKPATKQPSKPT
ncbi:unnamed protein product [Bursaphelenchus okinawaensis]|uniref:Uncharacterized protein n=1 Tax=Bursaphelenchus okinawaensis TaxID=465554 RepID=A0A811K1L5_9BILA|nr:unnamed protein product [Bursaphelenchus okinawaensis]CAG9089569.1 unnamed protein product [Bursaphelenchus okinawaensis]